METELSRKRDTVITRAREDEQRGDLGRARRRLKSLLRHTGYDPDLLAELGRISYEMRDLFEAGRYWLTSGATGDDVDRAIEAFIRQAGGKPESVRSQLPRVMRLASAEKYPAVVQQRLQELGLMEAVLATSARRRDVAGGRYWPILMLVLLSVIVLLCVASCAVGASTLVGYLFGW